VRSKKQIRGFTLVEILVVLGLFSSIMTIASGALFTTQAVNVRLQKSQSELDNASLSLETIARDIRYGAEFHCASSATKTGSDVVDTNMTMRRDCPFATTSPYLPGANYLFFKPSNASSSGDRVVYYATTTNGIGVVYKKEYFSGKATSTYRITSDEVNIKSLSYYVTGAYTSDASNDVGNKRDHTQPLVTLILSGETIASRNASSTSFAVETSISPRVLDK
jgi:prepilin-type N-terminal cleavage/methylation domain-containing protein